MLRYPASGHQEYQVRLARRTLPPARDYRKPEVYGQYPSKDANVVLLHIPSSRPTPQAFFNKPDPANGGASGRVCWQSCSFRQTCLGHGLERTSARGLPRRAAAFTCLHPSPFRGKSWVFRRNPIKLKIPTKTGNF
ncbi:MAG: hypothetical protein NT039_03145 [Candidatus Berkelbacteria bacterium]|nr:hypothetical protein [Candidatus Berkelbacteria bacterium]